MRNASLLTLGTGTRAEVALFLPVPRRRVSGQMFGNYGILCVRFKLPLGHTAGDLLVGWKLVSPD